MVKHRQSHGKHGVQIAGGGLQLPAMGFSDLRADVETQTQSFVLPVVVGAGERLEQQIHPVGVDGQAFVAKRQHQAVLLDASIDADRPARCTVVYGVRQRVGSLLADASEIALNGFGVVVVIADVGQRMSMANVDDDPDQRFEQVVDPIQVDHEAAAQAAAGELQHVVDQRRHAPSAALYCGHQGL